MKGFIADFAFVLLLPRMSQFVVLVVPLLMESFSAKFADPRLVTLMDSQVRVQSRGSVERLRTDLEWRKEGGGIKNDDLELNRLLTIGILIELIA